MAALSAILDVIDHTLELQHPGVARPDTSEIEAMLRNPATALVKYLDRLAALDERPLVLLLDEVDGLVGPAMVSFLTQLRHGYIARSRTPFLRAWSWSGNGRCATTRFGRRTVARSRG